MWQNGRILGVPVLIIPEQMIDELQSLTPKQAWKLINEDARALLVDIRSSMEFLFVGHPKGAVHVPWIDEPDWVVNPEFVTEVRKLILGGVVEDDAQIVARGVSLWTQSAPKSTEPRRGDRDRRLVTRSRPR